MTAIKNIFRTSKNV